METPMIERVAKAIWRSMGDNDDAFLDFRDDYLLYARAAIEAMREPTEGMLEAASRADLEDEWSAMIDAALK